MRTPQSGVQLVLCIALGGVVPSCTTTACGLLCWVGFQLHELGLVLLSIATLRCLCCLHSAAAFVTELCTQVCTDMAMLHFVQSMISSGLLPLSVVKRATALKRTGSRVPAQPSHTPASTNTHSGQIGRQLINPCSSWPNLGTNSKFARPSNVTAYTNVTACQSCSPTEQHKCASLQTQVCQLRRANNKLRAFSQRTNQQSL